MGLGVVPAVLAIWVRFSSPQSVRYLLGAGKIREAHAVIRRIARSAGDDVEVVEETAAARQEVAASTAGSAARGRMIFRYLGPLVALTFTIFFFNISGYGAQTWVPSLLVQHGFSMLRSFQLVLISNSLAPVFALILATSTIDIASQRRFSLGFIGIGGGVAFAALGAAFVLRWPVAWVVVTQIAFSVSYTAVNVFYYTLGTELFPTTVRAQTLAYATGFGRLGAVVGPPLLGMLLAAGLGVNNVIFLFATPMAIAGLICLAFLRRPTRFMSLEEASGVDELAQTPKAVSVE
jgi:putative MFS transporter